MKKELSLEAVEGVKEHLAQRGVSLGRTGEPIMPLEERVAETKRSEHMREYLELEAQILSMEEDLARIDETENVLMIWNQRESQIQAIYDQRWKALPLKERILRRLAGKGPQRFQYQEITPEESKRMKDPSSDLIRNLVKAYDQRDALETTLFTEEERAERERGRTQRHLMLEAGGGASTADYRKAARELLADVDPALVDEFAGKPRPITPDSVRRRLQGMMGKPAYQAYLATKDPALLLPSRSTFDEES